MPQYPAIHFIFPGDPETRTGGYAYGREIIAALRRAGAGVEVIALPDGFPVPGPEIRRRAGEILNGIPDNAAVIFDGLACGALPEEVARLAARTRLAALVHHPLADEAGIEEIESKRLFQSEKESLSHVRHVIVTSGFTALRLRDFGVSEDRVTVIEPGTEPAPLAEGSPEGAPVALLAVASVTPRKGYPDLLAALAPLTGLDWRLDCVGGLAMDRPHAEAVLAQAAPFGDRVRFHGALPPEDLPVLYHKADLFVSPSHYEGYGMAIAEAAACGLPILAAAGGAVPHTTAGRAARLVEPGDIPALTAALRDLIENRPARTALRERSLAARSDLPTWDMSGRKCLDVMRRVARGRRTVSDTGGRQVESFDADWLKLREPADAAARSRKLAAMLAGRFGGAKLLSITDLGAGTGSAMRWLAPRLPVPQLWRLVDGDAALLRRAGLDLPSGVADVETVVADLRDADLADLMRGTDVLSASALLDLVSAVWIDRLVAACAETGVAAWLTLSVDGADGWYPPQRGDWAAGRAFARDQARDKGFGPSLGPKAALYAAGCFRKAGFQTVTAKSDWLLGPESADLQRELLKGHAAAAMTADPARGRFHEAWAHRRLLHIAAGRGRVRIGHVDLLALPP